MRGPVWQGKLDALCGIYCAAHILALHNKDNYDELVDKHFIRLMRSAESAKPSLLTVTKIAKKGYKQSHLETIFNGVPASQTEGYRVARLSGAPAKALLRKYPKKDLIRSGVLAIVENEYDSGHWIALTGLGNNGDHYCYDPSLEKDLSGQLKSVSWKRGVLIVPRHFSGKQ